MALYQQIVSQELSVRDIESAVRETKTENKGKPARVFTSPLMSRAINLLNQRLSVPVDIKSRKNGKGQINIPFKSEQQLNEILRILLP
jgi:ParB-like chromosome segregation protein Spo0J